MKRIAGVAFVVTLAFSGVACSSSSDNAGKCPTQEQADAWDKDMDALELSPESGDLKEARSTMDKALTELASYLPSDLKSEVNDAKKALLEYLDLLEDIDLNDPSSISDETMKKLESIDEEGFDATFDKVTEYFKTNCPDLNLNLDDGGSSSGSDSAPSGDEPVSTVNED